jgi:hypothetical protein
MPLNTASHLMPKQVTGLIPELLLIIPFPDKLLLQGTSQGCGPIFFSMFQADICQEISSLWPPLWSSGQRSWLQIRRSQVRSRALQEKKSSGLERGPLSLVSTTEELLGRNSSGSGLESREYGSRVSSRWPPAKKLELTSLTSGGSSVGIVRLRTEATESFLSSLYSSLYIPVTLIVATRPVFVGPQNVYPNSSKWPVYHETRA